MNKIFALLLTLGCLAVTPSLADELTEELHFKPGSSSTQIRRGIARGETMRFLLGASGGQVMTVVVQSVEKNAVFEVWSNRGKLGESVEAAGKQKWSGVLPGSSPATYTIEVGSTRGGSEFNLYVEIR